MSSSWSSSRQGWPASIARPTPWTLSPGIVSGASAFSIRSSSASWPTGASPSPGPVGAPERSQGTGWGANKSYLIPALEIPGFILALNRFARVFSDEKEDGKSSYAVTPSTAWNHLVHGPWVIDNDNFGINQLGHPYQGSIYHNISRSAGLGYWESAGYTFVGSFLWEIAGETTKPSINDQVASGIAGSFLGEPLFRMASLLLERERPGFWRELGAALISPPTGFNRLVFGDRFRPVFPSHDPAIFWSAQIGAAVNTHTSGSSPGGFEHNEVTGDFTMSYGLPGKPGYRYTRPFDYFQFGVSAVSNVSDLLESVITRGLLFGSDYEAGDNYRGVWGLYGSYDYVSPHTFRVSTTAVSLRDHRPWWLSRLLALQGSVIAGLGYGAGGDISGVGQRTYHYGATGRAVLELRLLLGDLASLGASARLYHVHDALSTAPRGTETIGRLNANLTVRVHGPHAVGLQYLHSFRDGEYASLSNQHQKMTTISLTYTYLSDTRIRCGRMAKQGRAVNVGSRTFWGVLVFEDIVTQDAVNGLETVLPVDLLALLERASIVGNTDFIDAHTGNPGDPGRHFRFKAETLFL